MKEIGADIAFNYKTTSTNEILEKEGPVDVLVFPTHIITIILFCVSSETDKMCVCRYWDNVGGETLDAALVNASVGARFIVSIPYLLIAILTLIN